MSKVKQEYPILFVRNLHYGITSDELYKLFGKYGAIQYVYTQKPDFWLTRVKREIRLGNEQNTKGSAYVIFEDVRDAAVACDKLSGFQLEGRFLVVSFHQIDKLYENTTDIEMRKRNLAELKQKHNIE